MTAGKCSDTDDRIVIVFCQIEPRGQVPLVEPAIDLFVFGFSSICTE